MITFVLIILAILILPYILHFLGLEISEYYRKKYNDRELVKEFKNYRGYIGFYNNPSLMIYYTHHGVYTDCKWAHKILIYFGGCVLCWQWGNDFNENTGLDYASISYSWGWDSINGEKWWTDFRWRNRTFSNPFKATHYDNSWIIDFNNKTLVEKRQLDDINDYPLVDVRLNTTYRMKNDTVQDVSRIRWWIEQWEWSVPFLNKIGLGNYCKKINVDLEFQSDTELGVNRDSWKGGVMGATVRISDEPELLKLYLDIVKHQKLEKIPLLRTAIKNRIDYFMNEEKKY
jgi:hypothetical protein